MLQQKSLVDIAGMGIAKKGITPIIAIMLMITVVVSMAGVVYFMLVRTQESLGNQTQEEVESLFREIGMKIRIDNIAKNKIYVRNHGSRPVPNTSIALYVDNNWTEFNLSGPIEPGAVGILEIPELESGKTYTIKVTAGGSSDSMQVTVS